MSGKAFGVGVRLISMLQLMSCMWFRNILFGNVLSITVIGARVRTRFRPPLATLVTIYILRTVTRATIGSLVLVNRLMLACKLATNLVECVLTWAPVRLSRVPVNVAVVSCSKVPLVLSLFLRLPVCSILVLVVVIRSEVRLRPVCDILSKCMDIAFWLVWHKSLRCRPLRCTWPLPVRVVCNEVRVEVTLVASVLTR